MNTNLIPFFLEANSPIELVRLMFENNVKRGAYHQYFDIQNVNGKWFAWFNVRIEDIGELNGRKR
jgi:hypothetical protein